MRIVIIINSYIVIRYFITPYRLLPESLTWLLVKGRIKRAREIILTILRVNKLPPIEDLDKTLETFRDGVHTKDEQSLPNPAAERAAGRPETDGTGSTGKQRSPYSVLDLFKTPRIRSYSIIMFYL